MNYLKLKTYYSLAGRVISTVLLLLTFLAHDFSWQIFFLVLGLAWILWGFKPTTQDKLINAPLIPSSLYPVIYILSSLLFLLICVFRTQIGNYYLWFSFLYWCLLCLKFIASLYSLTSRKEETISAYYVFWLIAWFSIALIPITRYDICIEPQTLVILLVLGVIFLWSLLNCLILFLARKRLEKNTQKILLWLLNLSPLPAIALVSQVESLIILCGLNILFIFFIYYKTRIQKLSSTARRGLWVPLWLLRTSLFLWWIIGGTVSISLAWWLPFESDFFAASQWLRALIIGLFFIICLGILIEYSLPLLGRPEPKGYWHRDNTWGPILSSIGILLAFIPMLFLASPNNKPLRPPIRAELMSEAAILSDSHQEINLEVPDWLNDINRIYVVSRLRNGVEVPQMQAVAMIVVIDDEGLPKILHIRAGIDTADEELTRARAGIIAKHSKAEYDDYQMAYAANGEAFRRYNYIAGYFLGVGGSGMKGIRSMSLHYLPQYDNDGVCPELIIEKIFIQ